jgi:hypothetical protein
VKAAEVARQLTEAARLKEVSLIARDNPSIDVRSAWWI